MKPNVKRRTYQAGRQAYINLSLKKNEKYHNPILYLVTMHNLTTFYSVRYFVIYIQEKEREKIVHSIRSGPFNFIIFKNYNHEK